MEILLTNDDGIFAPGIAAMYSELKKLGNVHVAAPATPKSATGHSITLEPLVCSKVQIEGLFSGYSVDGSPADCVKLALMELIHTPIDLVVSGINYGANVGINVCYSGTVAAAMEGAFFGIPSIAVSAAIEEKMNFPKSVRLAIDVIKKLKPFEPGTVTNINIPPLDEGNPRGIKVVPQSTTGFNEHYQKHKGIRGQTVYQLAGTGHREKEEHRDTTALFDGFITVTGLHFDLTNHDQTCRLAEKLS